MSTINLVQGDTGPQIKATLTREGDTTPEDLDGASAVLRFRKKNTKVVLFTLNTVSSNEQLQQGDLYFVFSAGQLDLDAGFYQGEIEVVNSGVRETIYELVDFYLREDFG
jgi:hypothetical protein